MKMDPFRDALDGLGMFHDTEQPPLRSHFVGWLVDALQDPEYVRDVRLYTNAALLPEEAASIPVWDRDGSTLP